MAVEKFEKLDGYNILITGGSSGIGNSIARGLIDANANVFILSRRPPNMWECPMPEKWPSKTNWIEADFSHLHSTINCLNQWLKHHGKELNALIYSAVSYGSSKRRPIFETEIDEWDCVFEVGPRAYFAVCKAVLPYLLQQASSLIVSISSEVAYHPGPGRIDYAASKAASRSISASIAEEFKNSNLNVLDLLPKHMVDTPGIRKRRKPDTDLSNYNSPDIFISPIVKIIQSMGKDMNGKAFMIDRDSKVIPLNLEALPSQTYDTK